MQQPGEIYSEFFQTDISLKADKIMGEIPHYLTIDYSRFIMQLMPANLKNTHARFYPCQMHFFLLNIFSDTFTYSTGDY